MKKSGLTLVEILIAGMVLSVAMLVLFVVNSSSQKMTLDSYYEFLALQIAQEPIEVFRTVGFPACEGLTADYPLDSPTPVSDGGRGLYPLEAAMFERTITIDKSNAPIYLVTVEVSPREKTKARTWMRKAKTAVTLKGIIPIVK